MSEHWTPADWNDPQDDLSAGAGPDGGRRADAGPGGPGRDAEADPRLAEVSAWLASAPVPALPDGIEARISAALATEAQARAADSAQVRNEGPGTDTPAAGTLTPDRTLFPALPRARVRRSHSLGRRLVKSGPLLLVVLVLAGFGFLISRGSSSSSSSSGVAGPAAASSSANSNGGSKAAPADSASSTTGPGTGKQTSGSGAQVVVFRVTESGVSYRRATLAQQVAARLHGSSSSKGEHSPSAALYGCVLHFTGGSTPVLVDQATYQGTPVYVVASSSRVWVVGRGCTAAKTELVASVPLAG